MPRRIRYRIISGVRGRAAPALLWTGLAGSALSGGACETSEAHRALRVNGGDCVACHQADYDNALSPVHVQQLPLACGECHGLDTWSPAEGSDHGRFFPLRQAHAEAGCGDCHEAGFDSGATPVDCVGCHVDDYARAARPPHTGFPQECGRCHDARSFSPATFEHAWALEGQHAVAACGSCHVGDPPVYASTPTECIACHRSDFEMAQNPPHDGFSTACQDCHTPAGFRNGMAGGTDFAHSFPLRGAHARAACGSCHAGDPPVYAGTPTECIGCHQADYDRSPFPGHDAFPVECSGCHTTEAWIPASGAGHPENRFSTSGRHDFACQDCHNPDLGPNGRGNADCVGCHVGSHARARMDREHAGFRGYPAGDAPANFCLDCHPSGREEEGDGEEDD